MKKKFRRFAVNTAGPVSTAVSNFLASMILIPHSGKAEYGFFAFCLVIIQFFNSITNATTATPLSIEINSRSAVAGNVFFTLFKVNFLISVFCPLSIVATGLFFHVEPVTVTALALFGFSSSTRWYRRSYEFASHNGHNASLCDLVYSFLLIASAAVLYFQGAVNLQSISICFLVASVLSNLYLVAFGSRIPLSHFSTAPIGEYGRIWKQQARWALVGVFSTEMTANAHSYLVTWIVGPEAFAPIAIALLCWRPLATIFTAVTISERPRLAKLLAQDDKMGARREYNSFLTTTLLIYVANGLAILIALLIYTRYGIATKYNMEELVIVVSLWAVVVLMRSFRVPSSVYVQASKGFRELARIGMISAPVTLLATAGMLLIASPQFSIIGIIIGEIVLVTLISREKKRRATHG